MDQLVLRYRPPDRPLAVLALAATGPDPATARVVALAVARLDPRGGPPAVLVRRVDPGVPIPAAATAVHGIADHDVAGCPPFARLAPAVRRLLAGCNLAGFGITRYDLHLLAAELGRCGLPFGVTERRVVDLLAVSHRRHPRIRAEAHPLRRDHAEACVSEADTAALAVLAVRVACHFRLAVQSQHDLLASTDIAGPVQVRPVGAGPLPARQPVVDQVARADPGYLRWLFGRPLPDDARHWTSEVL